jgi:hypothetical protein
MMTGLPVKLTLLLCALRHNPNFQTLVLTRTKKDG